METTQVKIKLYLRQQQILWSLPIVKPISGNTLVRAEAPGVTGRALGTGQPCLEGWDCTFWQLSLHHLPHYHRERMGCLFLALNWAGSCPQLLTGLGPSRSQSLTLPKREWSGHKSLSTDFVECFERRVSSARFGHNFIPFKRDQHRVSRHTVVSLCSSLMLSSHSAKPFLL